MKKLSKIFSLIIILFCLSGCLNEEIASNNVYTTIYPIEYLTKYLYGETKNVSSIYPHGADVFTYTLTDKQQDTYAKSSLFVYNGLTEEKELAKDFLNKNKDILLIDVTHGLNYNYALEELWLSPNNYLMLAKNIKNNLEDYTTSKVIKEEIESNFKELEETLSYMDADLRDIATMAKSEGNVTLVVSSSKLQFLEKYGFDIIVLDSPNINESTIKSNFKNSKYSDIYLGSGEEPTALINDLVNNYHANIINVNMMYTLSDEEVNNNENYLTIMQNFIDNIRSTTLS